MIYNTRKQGKYSKSILDHIRRLNIYVCDNEYQTIVTLFRKLHLINTAQTIVYAKHWCGLQNNTNVNSILYVLYVYKYNMEYKVGIRYIDIA